MCTCQIASLKTDQKVREIQRVLAHYGKEFARNNFKMWAREIGQRGGFGAETLRTLKSQRCVNNSLKSLSQSLKSNLE